MGIYSSQAQIALSTCINRISQYLGLDVRAPLYMRLLGERIVIDDEGAHLVFYRFMGGPLRIDHKETTITRQVRARRR